MTTSRGVTAALFLLILTTVSARRVESTAKTSKILNLIPLTSGFVRSKLYNAPMTNESNNEKQYCVGIPEVHISYRYVRAANIYEALQKAQDGDYTHEDIVYTESARDLPTTIYDDEMNPVADYMDGVWDE